MHPDDHVCLCFRVSQRKLVTFMRRERPRVASQLSDCLGAGTGCQWCVPFLCTLFTQWQQGETPALEVSPETYAQERAAYRAARRTRSGESISPPEDADERAGGTGGTGGTGGAGGAGDIEDAGDAGGDRDNRTAD